MFELADSLLGVYKVDNMSYCIHFGVKKIVAELKRKLDRGKNPAATQNPLLTQKQSQPSTTSKPLPRSPLPGTSKAAAADLLQKQNQANKKKFPGLDVSAILDDNEEEENADDSQHPQSPTMIEKTIIENEQENSFTPPSRTSDTPAADAAAQESGSNKERELSEDDSESPFPPKGRASLPKYTSTPFVEKRPSTAKQRNQGGGFISDEDNNEDENMEQEEEDVAISPIKGVGRLIVPESPAISEEDDSFKTADDDDLSVDEVGPTQ
jgi:hypothetical protein